MNPAMQTCLNILKLSDAMVAGKIATMNDAAAARRPSGNENPVVWLVGHLLASRNYLLGLLAEQHDIPFWDRISAKYDPDADYPTLAELAAAWAEVAAKLGSAMEATSDEGFARAIDWNIPLEDRTVRGAILFYTYHEAWHLGQIAYARKGMGMDGLIPF